MSTHTAIILNDRGEEVRRFPVEIQTRREGDRHVTIYDPAITLRNGETLTFDPPVTITLGDLR